MKLTLLQFNTKNDKYPINTDECLSNAILSISANK